MYLKHLFSAFLLGALTVGATFNTNANQRQYYETRICADCDYNYALATAAEIKPAINCTGGDDPFNSDTAQAQQCYATPIKILVADANSRNIWQFENTYTNQGQPLYKLTNEVNYHSQTPAGAIQLVNQLLDIYEEMDALAVEYTNKLNAGEFDYVISEAYPSNIIRTTQTETDQCEAYEYDKALKAAFNTDYKTTLQVQMQDQLNARSNLLGGLLEIKLTNLSFNIGSSTVSIGGSWKFSRDSKYISNVFGDGSLNKRTQVTFNVSMTNNGVKLTLNELQTLFDGKTLEDLKAQTYSAASINECLANALDAVLPKTVASPSSGGASFGNVALIGSGHSIPGSSGGTTTCKHTYYINGVEIMSFEGSCP